MPDHVGHDGILVVSDSASVWHDYIDTSADRRDGAGESGGDDLGGFFTGGDEGVAVGDTGQQRADVGGGDYFQEGVGGVVSEAADFAGGVVEGETGFGAKVANRSLVKPLFARHAEVLLVPKVNQPHDAPEVVDPVRVIERNTPAVWLGRKAAEEQDTRVRGQEGLERMALSREISGHGR